MVGFIADAVRVVMGSVGILVLALEGWWSFKTIKDTSWGGMVAVVDGDGIDGGTRTGDGVGNGGRVGNGSWVRILGSGSDAVGPAAGGLGEGK